MIRALVFVGLIGAGGAAAEAPSVGPLSPTAAVSADRVARPAPRDRALPRARWEQRRDGALWTRVVMSAVQTHGTPLLDVVPKDIADWCPAYPENGSEDRAAFWAGFISTLARYESTFDQRAVGGGDRWFGLMQIYPPTAAFRSCRVQTGAGLQRGSDNLNCAVRIMAITVPRDQAISTKDTRWRGVAADWGPMRTDWMRRDMQRYTKRQVYCRRLEEVRPVARPTGRPRG